MHARAYTHEQQMGAPETLSPTPFALIIVYQPQSYDLSLMPSPF